MTTEESREDPVIQVVAVPEVVTVLHEHVELAVRSASEKPETRTGVLELRVHGVSGTPPASMLGIRADQVGRVAGGQVTGFYRPFADVKLPNRDAIETPVAVEAYSWAGLTSGASGFMGWLIRALWLLLLPFALSNLAYWARPQLEFRELDDIDDHDRATTTYQANVYRQARATAWMVRFGCLALTALLVLAACTISVDALAWQCFRNGEAVCPNTPGWLGFFAHKTLPHRLAIAAMLPVLGLALLWFLSRKSLARCESVSELDLPAAAHPVLRHRWLWSGQRRTTRLQRSHLAAGLWVVMGYIGLPLLDNDQWDLNVVFRDIVQFGVPAGLLVAILLAVWIHPDDMEALTPAEKGKDGKRLPADTPVQAVPVADDNTNFKGWSGAGPGNALLLVTLAAFAAFEVALWRGVDRTGVEIREHVPGANLWFIGVFVLLAFVGLALFLLGRVATVLAWVLAILGTVLIVASSSWLWRDPDSPLKDKPLSSVASHVPQQWVPAVPLIALAVYIAALGIWQRKRSNDSQYLMQAWGGAGSSMLFGAAIWVALLFTTAGVAGVANYLNGTKRSVNELGTGGVLTVPQVMVWAPVGQVLWLLGTIAIALWCYKRVTGGFGYRGLRREFDAQLWADEVPAREAGDCRKARTAAAFSHRAEAILNAIGYLVPVLAIAIIVGAETGEAPSKVFTGLSSQASWISNLSLLLVSFAAVGLIAYAARERTSEGARKVVGILWDLTTYWPRASHPLGPPCYAERVEPEVAFRTQWALGCAREETQDTEDREDTEDTNDKKDTGATRDTPVEDKTSAESDAEVEINDTARDAAGGILTDTLQAAPQAGHADPTSASMVILSGHSQGSLIVAAAAARLPRCCLKHVRIITYGCQVRAWYGRIFPAVFGPAHVGYVDTGGPPLFKDPGIDVLARPLPDNNDTAEPSLSGTHRVFPPASLLWRLKESAVEGPFRQADAGPGARLLWVNLFRRSDPLGFHALGDYEVTHDSGGSWATRPGDPLENYGKLPRAQRPVACSHDTGVDVYVCEVPPDAAGDPTPKVQTHSGYPHADEYVGQIDAWAKLAPPAQQPTRLDRVDFLPL